MAKGPTWSRLEANATRPYRETLPYVGFTPTTPQRAAGCLIDPPVSLPRARGENPAATAAAEPPDEPPALNLRFQGFRVMPNNGLKVCPPAHSGTFDLAMGIPPRHSSIWIVASEVSGILFA